jgi:hypothetical protein
VFPDRIRGFDEKTFVVIQHKRHHYGNSAEDNVL